MRLYHFTCHDSAPLIERCGHLLPHPQVQLDGRKLIWLTDLEAPTRATLGLTSRTLVCDRMEYRVTVDTDAVRWVQYARQLTGPTRRRALELNEAPGVRPMHWLVATEPVPVITVERA